MRDVIAKRKEKKKDEIKSAHLSEGDQWKVASWVHG